MSRTDLERALAVVRGFQTGAVFTLQIATPASFSQNLHLGTYDVEHGRALHFALVMQIADAIRKAREAARR